MAPVLSASTYTTPTLRFAGLVGLPLTVAFSLVLVIGVARGDRIGTVVFSVFGIALSSHVYRVSLRPRLILRPGAVEVVNPYGRVAIPAGAVTGARMAPFEKKHIFERDLGDILYIDATSVTVRVWAIQAGTDAGLARGRDVAQAVMRHRRFSSGTKM